MRRAFLSLLDRANALNAKPEFYNTFTANCTTVLFRLVKAMDPSLPLDLRIILSGRLPEYMQDHDFLKAKGDIADVRARALITPAGIAAGNPDDFAGAIRAAWRAQNPQAAQ